jgi:hypothetical protein
MENSYSWKERKAAKESDLVSWRFANAEGDKVLNESRYLRNGDTWIGLDPIYRTATFQIEE